MCECEAIIKQLEARILELEEKTYGMFNGIEHLRTLPLKIQTETLKHIGEYKSVELMEKVKKLLKSKST